MRVKCPFYSIPFLWTLVTLWPVNAHSVPSLWQSMSHHNTLVVDLPARMERKRDSHGYRWDWLEEAQARGPGIEGTHPAKLTPEPLILVSWIRPQYTIRETWWWWCWAGEREMGQVRREWNVSGKEQRQGRVGKSGWPVGLIGGVATLFYFPGQNLLTKSCVTCTSDFAGSGLSRFNT